MNTALFSTESTEKKSYRDLLREEFNRRKERNPAYSVRAFAKSIGLGKTSVSDALALKRHLSVSNIVATAERLRWDSDTLQSALHEIRSSRRSVTPKGSLPVHSGHFVIE